MDPKVLEEIIRDYDVISHYCHNCRRTVKKYLIKAHVLEYDQLMAQYKCEDCGDRRFYDLNVKKN